MALGTCFQWEFAPPGRAVHCKVMPTSLIHSPGSWKAQIAHCLQLPHSLHLFWAPDWLFAELFELDGSCRNTVLLAENRNWGEGIFRAVLGPEDYCSPPGHATEMWCGHLEMTLVVTFIHLGKKAWPSSQIFAAVCQGRTEVEKSLGWCRKRYLKARHLRTALGK